MSWLGKILTFLVLVGSVVSAAFTVNVYVARTNWKVRADATEKALKESESNRIAEQRKWQTDSEQLVGLLKAEKTRTEQLDKDLIALTELSKKGDAAYKELLAHESDADVREKILIAQQKATDAAVADIRLRINDLENKGVDLRLAKADADRLRVSAEGEAKFQRTVADDNATKVLALQAQVAELRQSGGSGTAAVLRTIDKVPAPLPDGIRGTVLRDISGDFVHISLGIDAGLEPGSRLDIYRETGGGKYLGTLIVTKSLYPKEAIAEFRPARRVPLSQLRSDELPRKDDLVGIIANSPTGRNP